MLSQVITFDKLFPSVSAGFRTSPSVSVKSRGAGGANRGPSGEVWGGLSRPFGRGVGVRPDNALRMNYDYSSPEAVPAFDPCPRVCIWSHRADRGSIPPRWGDDPGSRAGPARGFAAVRGGRAVVPLRTPQNGSGGVKTGYGGGAPMQAPAVQPGGRLFAPDGRHAAPEAPRALQTYPTTSASGRGG